MVIVGVKFEEVGYVVVCLLHFESGEASKLRVNVAGLNVLSQRG